LNGYTKQSTIMVFTSWVFKLLFKVGYVLEYTIHIESVCYWKIDHGRC